MGTKRLKKIVLIAVASANMAVAQTQPSGVPFRRGVGVLVTGDAPADEAANAANLREQAGRDEERGPATRPTTQPSARLAKFRVRFNRTPLTTLRALSAVPDPKIDEAAKFQADVQAGRWEEVGKTIATFSPPEAKQLYRHLLADLLAPPSPTPPQGAQPGIPVEPQGPRPPGGAAGQFFLSPDDVLAILSIAPGELDSEQIDPLGQLLSRATAGSGVIEPIIARLEQGVRNIGGNDPAARQRAAVLLVAANRPLEAVGFLPPLIDDLPSNDVKLLDLHSRCLTALSAKEDDKSARAWEVTRALLIHPQAGQKERDGAMSRAAELLPRLPKQVAAEWLDAAFSKKAEQGVSVLAGAGTAVSQNFLSRDLVKRDRDLNQQKVVVDQLLAQTPDIQRWSPLLQALAALWMQEADYARSRPTQSQLAQQRIVYDEDGNRIIQPAPPNEAPPMNPTKLLSAAPSEKWLAALEPSMRAAILANVVQMQFKNDTPQEAIGTIEVLAGLHPKLARDLCTEMFRSLGRVWTVNLSMNRQSGYVISASGSYMPIMQNVVLTRLGQARNLADLSSLLRRIEKLGIEAPDQTAVVAAFVAAHSQAEVFRIENIQDVFGPADQMSRDALLTLTQSMRQRLATSWRSSAVQQQNQTKRTDKETDAEITRGYQLLADLLKQRLAKESDWKLLLVQAAAMFDWAEFDYGKQVELAVYTSRRDQAFELFGQAARQYASSLPQIKLAEQVPQAYTQWFSAALGASDLSALTRQSQPSPTQIQQIRTALFSIPGEAGERHVAAFGRFLADSINSLKPELKHRFLTTGMQVLGDHESAREARMLVRYYQDLLTEIEFHAEVDGDPIIGHSKPFGLHLMIRHTQTLGRESGGFGKYLASSQGGSGAMLGPNGQPLSYRDEFEKKIREALVERFQIISIAWHEQKVEPIPYGKPGWRQTPLAYLLLKPKDASVDQIPPIQIDLDLADRQGSVILPVTSQVVLVDARPENIAARPVSKVEISQILDQREAAAGKLSLDIKASASGLLPDLADLLDLSIPGFNIDKTSDLGLVINKMDTEGDRPAPVSEHAWLLNLSAARNDDAGLSFHFPQSRSPGAKMIYKQYSDADLSDVDPQLAVVGLPIRTSRWWINGVIGAIVAVAIVIAGIIFTRRSARPGRQIAPLYRIPATLTPFTLLDLLRRIEADNALRLPAEHRQRLTHDIKQLQESYFAPANGNGSGNDHSDLSAIAMHWVRQTAMRG